MEPDAAAAMIDALNRLEAIRAADPELARAARGYVGGVRDRTEWEGRSVPFWSTVFEAYIEGYRAALAASPSEEVEAALVAADRLAEYVEFQGRSGHNWPTTAEAQRTYITVRRALAALRTTKEPDARG